MSTTKRQGPGSGVLVTGATGFIGSHLVEALVRRGCEVRALARKTSDRQWIRDLPIRWCWGDVRDRASLGGAVEGVDWIFHLAGLTKAHSYEAYFAANAQGTENILRACMDLELPPSKFVLVSSLAASGPSSPEIPRKELDPPRPVSHYGLSKLQAERVALSHAHELPVVVVRPAAVYGPRDRDILAFFRLIRRGWNLAVGEGERLVSMIHVRDLVGGILLAAQARVASGSTFFLSDGEVHRWQEVAELLGRIMGIRVRTVRIPKSVAGGVAWGSEMVSRLTDLPPLLNRQKVREMLQASWACDIRLGKEQLGFQPEIPLEQGLEETYSWYRGQGWI